MSVLSPSALEALRSKVPGDVLAICRRLRAAGHQAHLVGGGVDCFSCERFGAAKHVGWKGVSFLNRNHMLWAWLSMFSVGATDVYIRLCSMGVLKDLRFV